MIAVDTHNFEKTVVLGIGQLLVTIMNDNSAFKPLAAQAYEKIKAASASKSSKELTVAIKSFTKEIVAQKETMYALSHKSVLSLLDDHFLSKKSLFSPDFIIRVQAIREKLLDKSIAPTDVVSMTNELVVEIVSSMEAMKQRLNFKDKPYEEGDFKKGVETINKTDVAVASKRIYRELDRLSKILVDKHPEHKELIQIKTEVTLETQDNISFFKCVDLISRVSNEIFMLNESALNKERNYVFEMASKLKDMSDLCNSILSSNVDAECNVIAFQDDIESTLTTIKSGASSFRNLEHAKKEILKNLSVIQERVKRFADAQKEIIGKQQRTIQSHTLTIKNVSERASKFETQLGIAKIDMLHDSLTSLPNRRYFDKKLDEVFLKWERNQATLSLAIIDIDYFKKVNDMHGHAVGDEVLKHVAKTINNLTSKFPQLMAARIGGEEFAVICDNLSTEDSKRLSIEINKEIQKHPFIDKNNQIKIDLTVSVGLSFMNESNKTLADLYKCADRSLYMAKENGRNASWCMGAQIVSKPKVH